LAVEETAFGSGERRYVETDNEDDSIMKIVIMNFAMSSVVYFSHR
jgi:hypothetical protein